MENVSYRISEPIVLTGVHDITICAYSIGGGMFPCIDLVDCYNIHITQCELHDSRKLGISLKGCTNVLIEDCCLDNVQSGICSVNGSNIQVRNNKIQKLGPHGAMVKFENAGFGNDCTGSFYANNNFALS